MRPWCLGVIVSACFFLPGPSRAQKTVFAPPVVHDLGITNVRLEMYGWEDADKNWTPSPGLFAANGSMADQLIHGRYQMALSGRWPSGSREVFGFVGGPYPNESKFEVVRFARTANNIDLTVRRLDTGGKGDGYRSWKTIYISAMLPADLPDGKYSLQCTVTNADGQPDPMTKSTPHCQVLAPDPQEVEIKKQREALKKLSEEELVKTYIEAGRSLGSSALAPREIPVPDLAAHEFNDVKYLRFCDCGDEIVRRGGKAVPYLITTLQKQAPLSGQVKDRYPFGFGRAIMELMVRIGDPRPVALLVNILDGLDGKASMPLRHSAIDSLEQLTFVTFRRQDLVDGRTRWAVEDTRATPGDQRDPIFGAAGPSGHAATFRTWLSHEGKDPARWMSLARLRAREAMEGRDLRASYAAIDFLQNGGAELSRDDDPPQTMKHIGGILSEARQVGFRSGNYDYQIDGQLLPLTIGDWTAKLANYGPRARPSVKALIRIDAEIAVPSGKRVAELGRIGGEEVVAYLVKRLPELEERLGGANLDARVNADEISEERLKQMVLAAQVSQWTISRWTGRVFERTADVQKWWEENQKKSQETWLRESLEPTAARADGGDEMAVRVLAMIVPDMPARKGEVSRVEWLGQNKGRLTYDEWAGCFHVKAAASE